MCGWITNKVLQYIAQGTALNTPDNHKGKEHIKEYICVCVCV